MYFVLVTRGLRLQAKVAKDTRQLRNFQERIRELRAKFEKIKEGCYSAFPR